MRAFIAGAALSSALAACNSGGTPTTIAIKSTGGPLDAVAFRGNFDPTWQIATQTTATDYSFVVDEPYWVSVACHIPGATTDHMLIQYARTLDDPHEIDDAFCPHSDAPLLSVTGTMIQAGGVAMTTSDRAPYPYWFFRQYAPAGTYTMYAASADHVLIQRDLRLTDDIQFPMLDVDATGTAVVPQPFKITNPRSDKDVTPVAYVGVEAANQPGSTLYFYSDDPAKAAILPNAALTDNDVQTVSLRETTQRADHFTLRAYRRSYHVGDPTDFTLPELPDGVQWSTDGDVAVTWSSLPANTPFIFQISGHGPAGSFQRRTETVDVSTSFLHTTNIHGLRFDTDVPGFHKELAADLTQLTYLSAYGQIHGATIREAPTISVTDQVVLNPPDTSSE